MHMSARKNGSMVLRKLVCLTLAVWLAQPAFGAKSLEETFDVLKTRTGTYTNVTVTSRADSYIFITHANGMTSIKVQDLTREAQQKLGYVTAPPPPEVTTNRPAAAPVKPLIGGEQKVNTNEIPSGLWAVGLGMVIALVAASLLSYLFLSYCSLLICFKTKTPAGALVWLPVVQMIPLLRAAGMSGWWLLIAPVAYIPWSFKIARACNGGAGMALLLLFPLTSVFAFVYLAFSSVSKPATAPQKIKAVPIQCQDQSSTQAPPLPPPPAQARPQNA
jgi:hypothetical protein